MISTTYNKPLAIIPIKLKLNKDEKELKVNISLKNTYSMIPTKWIEHTETKPFSMIPIKLILNKDEKNLKSLSV